MAATVSNSMALAGLTTAPLVSPMLNNAISMPILGVTVLTLFACGLGTFAAIGYDPKPPRGGRLMVRGLSTVIVGGAAVAVMPRALGFEWSSDGVEGGLGAITCFALWFLLPPAIDKGQQLVAEFRLADWIPNGWRRKTAEAPPPQAMPPALPPDNPPAGPPGANQEPKP